MRRLARRASARARVVHRSRDKLQVAERKANGMRYRGVVPPARRTPSLELGFELRRLREAKRLRAAEVAAELEISESTLSRKESGRIGISDRDLDRLFSLYQVSEPERRRLRDLANRPGSVTSLRPRRTRSSGALSSTLERYIELEEVATEISIYAAMVVPGLVQTPEYAAAIIKATPVPEEEFVRPRMITRMARQGVFERQPPPQLRIIIDESVLFRPIGGHDVMRRQMLRLIEISERPHVSLRVLTLAIGAHPALTGQFTVLKMDTEEAHVFCDGLTSGSIRSKPDDVQRYRACYDRLNRLVLSEQDSVAQFQVAADRFRE